MKNRGLVLIFSVLALISTVSAVDLEMNISSSKIWMGDSVTFNCWYSGTFPENETFSTPWLAIEKTSQTKYLTEISHANYQTSYNPPILGTYDVFCSNGTLNSSEVSFEVRDLETTILEKPDAIYLDDNFVLNVSVKEKSDSEINITDNSLSFAIFLGDDEVAINSDQTYYSQIDKKWIITTENVSYEDGFDDGTYDLKVQSTFEGKNSVSVEGIELKDPVEFEVVDMGETWISDERNVTLILIASYKGTVLQITEDDLRIYVNNQKISKEITILDITYIGDYAYVKISLPSLDPGNYNMIIRFIYGDIGFKEHIHKISYVVEVSGEVLNSDNKGVKSEFAFRNGGETAVIKTTTSGSYSGELPPGTYDVEMKFPDATLMFDDVDMDEFDDPVKFDNPSVKGDIQGIGTLEVYVFEIDLDYDEVELTLKYSDSGVSDESKINYVYRCSDWNFGARKCGEDWELIDGTDFDYVRNTVTFEQNGLSAFLIGFEKRLILDAGSDSNQYYLGDIMKITGYTEDDDKEPISETKITASVKGTTIKNTVYTDEDGVFYLEILAPNKEGTFDVIVRADKTPLDSVETEFEINTVRSQELSVIGPDNFKFEQGEENTVKFSVINTGQTDFRDLKVTVSGIPENYYFLSDSEIPDIREDTEVPVTLNFIIPENASKSTYSGIFKVEYGDSYLEKKFLLTISEKAVQNNTDDKGFSFPKINLIPTGGFTFPAISIGNPWIITIAGLSFGGAYILKKLKLKKARPKKGSALKDIERLLFDIKEEINKDVFERKKREEDRSYG
jgi:hypothetical protein